MNSSVAHSLQQPILTSIARIVLKLHDRHSFDALTQPPVWAESTCDAMQQLVTLMTQLRSPTQAWQSPKPSTPETLLPYVQDEVQELLATLKPPQNEGQTTSSESSFILLDALVSALLWGVARSSYQTMQFIEGIQVQARPPNQSWRSGILRLAVILQIQDVTPAIAAVDLATGYSPQPLLTSDWQIQPHEDLLDADPTANWVDAISPVSPGWIDQQLEVINQQLVTTLPTVRSWFAGIPVDCLMPDSDWRSGRLHLTLGFDFMPHPLPIANSLTEATLVEVELLELEAEVPRNMTLAEVQAAPPTVTVVDLPLTPAIANTIVRLSDAVIEAKFAQLATRQEIVRSLNSLQSQSAGSKLASSAMSELQLVQAADRISGLTHASASASFCLLQPELLVDELFPKLLWHITRSSFVGMQWLGGVECQVLQPGASWQPGILRLMLVLAGQTSADRWLIDLATGRSVDADSWALPTTAIAHGQNSLLTSPISVAQLQAQIWQPIQSAAPEIACLEAGVAIDWLTSTHDWQPGHLQLHAGLEFIPDLFC